MLPNGSGSHSWNLAQKHSKHGALAPKPCPIVRMTVKAAMCQVLSFFLFPLYMAFTIDLCMYRKSAPF